jgi:hypothetical protein
MDNRDIHCSEAVVRLVGAIGFAGDLGVEGQF